MAALASAGREPLLKQEQSSSTAKPTISKGQDGVLEHALHIVAMTDQTRCHAITP